MGTHLYMNHCFTSCKEMYQALSRFTVLQATGNWARAWEQGYKVLKTAASKR